MWSLVFFVWLPSHFQSSVLDVSAVSSGVCEDSWRSSWSWWDQQETWAERWQSSSWRQGRHDEESEEEEVAGATAAVSGAAVAPAAAASGAAAAAASGAAAWLADESPGGPSGAAEERQSQRRSDVSGRWSDVSGRWRNVSAGGAASSVSSRAVWLVAAHADARRSWLLGRRAVSAVAARRSCLVGRRAVSPVAAPTPAAAVSARLADRLARLYGEPARKSDTVLGHDAPEFE